MDFFQTIMGKKFFEAQLPKLIKSLEGLSEEIKRSNDLKESNQISSNISIPHASEIQKSDEYSEIIEKYIQIVLKDIEDNNSKGLSCAPFSVDYRYTEDVKNIFKSKGYEFRPAGYSGGVLQKNEYICW